MFNWVFFFFFFFFFTTFDPREKILYQYSRLNPFIASTARNELYGREYDLEKVTYNYI